MEHWKDIRGYKGLYKISDMGNVKTHYKKTRLLKKSTSRTGKLYVKLSKKGKTKTKYIHILVLETFVGKSEGRIACHNNMDRTDNRLDNLRWDTKANAVIDQIKRNLHKCGPKANKAKLTVMDVKGIKSLLRANMRQCEIAREYGVNQSSISDIATGKTWKHLSFL